MIIFPRSTVNRNFMSPSSSSSIEEKSACYFQRVGGNLFIRHIRKYSYLGRADGIGNKLGNESPEGILWVFPSLPLAKIIIVFVVY